MKKLLLVLMCMVSFTQIKAQDSTEVVETYRRNFVRSGLGTKYELLQEASEYAGINMGPLYATAIEFAINNASLLASDVILRDIAILSVNMLKKYQYKESAENIWVLFTAYTENMVRIPALQSLAELAKENKRVIQELNSYVYTQISLFKTGIRVDSSVIDAAVIALGKLGDASSFKPLFEAYTATINKSVTDNAAASMNQLSGDYAAFLENLIKIALPSDKVAALNAGLTSDSIQPDKRNALAETALSVCVMHQSAKQSDMPQIDALRSLATKHLISTEWQAASPLAVRNFNDLQASYRRGQVTKSSFLESIALLGAMGTHEAAQSLSTYLQLMNTETEQGKAFDEQISLAVVNNVGKLGDKIAFDYLLYMGYLQYTDTVKKAAKDALQKLRW